MTCSCGAPIQPAQVKCDYCGSALRGFTAAAPVAQPIVAQPGMVQPMMQPVMMQPVLPPGARVIMVNNTRAVWSLITSIVLTWIPILGALIAIYLGHSARKQIRVSGERGDGFALVGLGIGWLSLLGWTFSLIGMASR
jgi:hypothetical protein